MSRPCLWGSQRIIGIECCLVYKWRWKLFFLNTRFPYKSVPFLFPPSLQIISIPALSSTSMCLLHSCSSCLGWLHLLSGVLFRDNKTNDHRWIIFDSSVSKCKYQFPTGPEISERQLKEPQLHLSGLRKANHLLLHW